VAKLLLRYAAKTISRSTKCPNSSRRSQAAATADEHDSY
jgi:hypothetical protein